MTRVNGDVYVASQTGQAQQPAPQRGLLVIYSALMLTKLSRALLGENADRHLISDKPPGD